MMNAKIRSLLDFLPALFLAVVSAVVLFVPIFFAGAEVVVAGAFVALVLVVVVAWVVSAWREIRGSN